MTAIEQPMEMLVLLEFSLMSHAFSFQIPIRDHQALKTLTDEIKIFDTIHHPNLVEYYGVEVHRVVLSMFRLM